MLKAPKAVTTPTATAKELYAARRLSSTNVLVLYRSGDSTGQAVAAYYQSVRAIPASQVVAVTLAWTPSGNTCSAADANALLDTVIPHLTGKPIAIIVTCGYWPNQITGLAPNWTISEVLTAPHKLKAAALGNASIKKLPASWLNDYPDSLKVGAAMPMLYSAGLGINSVCPYLFAPKAGRYTAYGNEATYVHFRLEVSPSASGDPSGNEETRIKRLIDDAIAAEQAQMYDFGTVILNGSTTLNYPVGSPAAFEIQNVGIRYKKLYRYNMAGEPQAWQTGLFFAGPVPSTWDAGYRSTVRPSAANGFIYRLAGYTGTAQVAAAEPTWPTTIGARVVDNECTWECAAALSNSLPAGDTRLMPYKGGTFTPANYTDVFFHVVGTDAYAGGVEEQPIDRTSFTYRRGAVSGWGQSFSAIPHTVSGIDFDYGSRTLTNFGDSNALNTNVSVSCANELSVSAARFFVRCTNAVTTATAALSGNTFTLKEDGATVATFAVSGTLRTIMNTFNSTSPAGWYAAVDSNHGESRCQQSLRAGCCISIGSSVEPTIDHGFKSNYIAECLWHGEAIGEVAAKMAMPSIEATTTVPRGCMFFGDPLYRPFGHRLT